MGGERDADPAIYLHRIVTDPGFRGHNLVLKVIEWAKQYAVTNGLSYVRLDAFADNAKLSDHYVNCGFKIIGCVTLQSSDALPKHYAGNPLSLFEIAVNDV